ncbi:hypothetical protein C8R44DRAFT_791973 [Mycena epipterygia]|nr:hypothetical protein C8R44DRAFT_791973 [Mycena epipterygia]
MPGAGKTVLASLVVHHLESRSHSENIGVACIYLNYKEAEFDSAESAGCSWETAIVGETYLQCGTCL